MAHMHTAGFMTRIDSEPMKKKITLIAYCNSQQCAGSGHISSRGVAKGVSDIRQSECSDCGHALFWKRRRKS